MNLMLTQANALRIPLADESVHMVCCSPPYWGLRDYGTATWEGGDPGCDHIAYRPSLESGLRNDGRKHKGLYEGEKATKLASPYRDECKKCGAIRIDNQLGLEPTPEQYVANMVAVFREVWRVLRPDGTLWLNMGDSYATSQAGNTHWNNDIGNNRYYESGEIKLAKRYIPPGLKPKDLCGIPWRVAFALQADGWWLRSDIIWSKPNPMPESVTDRPTKAHEYLFLMTKSAKYYYDADAVREGQSENSHPGIYRNPHKLEQMKNGGAQSFLPGKNVQPEDGKRNRRTVWHIATAPYSGAHFATYPPALVEPCIKAGTSERGVCPECGAPWERVVEKPKPPIEVFTNTAQPQDGFVNTSPNKYGKGQGQKQQNWKNENPTTTLGWQPTCECKRVCPSCAGGSVEWTVNSPCC